MNKRIILEYTSGAYRGLRQIVGTEDQLRTRLTPEVTELPSFIEGANFIEGRTGSCSLIRVKPRYILYRELIVPEQGTPALFHPSQR